MEFDNKTILIIAAILFVLYMLSQRGTSSYENTAIPMTNTAIPMMNAARQMITGAIPRPKKEPYCPSCTR